MTLNYNEVLDFVKENDVKFVKLAFCDIMGLQKNISILADKLEEAMRSGVYFDSDNIAGFSTSGGDELMLMPDLSTLSVLPWRPQQGRVIRFFCNVLHADGSPCGYDGRTLLTSAQDKCREAGYECALSTEAEFYIFKTDELGSPTLKPYDEGGYLDMPPLDKGENIRREICLSLLEMGIEPEKSHHESGPGQNEIDFKHSLPIKAADNFLAFKSLVKAVCGRNGVYASFLPKPLKGHSGSGLHINLSLKDRNGKNIFTRAAGGGLGSSAQSFVAGVLRRMVEMTIFLNPIANSYERFGKCEAPAMVDWAYGSRKALIRIPCAADDKNRMEIRSADCAANPYLAFALILNAGLEGINEGLQLQDNAESVPLPAELKDAVNAAAASEWVDNIIGKSVKERFIAAVEAFDKANGRDKLFGLV